MKRHIIKTAFAALICALLLSNAAALFAANNVQVKEKKVVDLPKKYTEQIVKEHEKFIKAFTNSEMAHRYYFKQIYDAVNRGKKEPTKESLKAMEFELKLLDKELCACAKRYSQNIRVARAAMEEMNYGERARFVKALSLIFASPAYAFDSSPLNSIEAGLNNIAAGTANIGYDNLEDHYRAQAANAKAGDIAASGVCLVTTAGLTIGGLALATVAAPAVTTVGGGVLLFVSVTAGLTGGMLATGDAAIGFIDSITEDEHDTKLLKKYAMGFSLLSAGTGAAGGLASAVETVKLAVDVTDSTKDAWIPLLNEAEDPKMPGREGVAAVKNANESAGANSSSDRGSGGGHGH